MPCECEHIKSCGFIIYQKKKGVTKPQCTKNQAECGRLDNTIPEFPLEKEELLTADEVVMYSKQIGY